jgi:hypothetical protein
LWTVTDRWGDVPYSEALRGAGALLPKYDEQQDIYEGLINDITAANDMFNPNGGPLPGDKYMYAGDISKWRKFGNSLKMLMALRLSKRFPAAGGYAAEKFNEALNSPYGYMTDNADNFIVDYPGGNFRNPFWSLHVSQDIAVSLTFTDVLTGLTNDPRRDAMASTQTGCPFGLVGAAPIGVPYARTFNPPFSDEGAPLVIINAASILLAKAEAIERGWVPGMTTADAKVAYDQAITVSFEQWGKTVPAPYLTTGPANYLTGTGVLTIGGASVVGSSAVTATPIERINLQQYIAFYPGGVQGWSNWRRTGVPNLQPTIFSVNNSGEIPRRIPYGVQDYNTNAVQLNIAIARLPGGDTQDEYVWWDRP